MFPVVSQGVEGNFIGGIFIIYKELDTLHFMYAFSALTGAEPTICSVSLIT
jgi:hypothetical protein